MTDPASDRPPEPTSPYSAGPELPVGDVHHDEAQWRALEATVRALDHQGRTGANWFYWVAALSLVNSVLLHANANIVFVVGLGVTLVVDVLAKGIAQQRPDLAQTAHIVAIGFAVVASLAAFGFGWLARRRYLVVYAVGMVLYLLDGVLLVVVFREHALFSGAFHVLALVSMWGGFRAYRRLNALEAALAPRSDEGSEPMA